MHGQMYDRRRFAGVGVAILLFAGVSQSQPFSPRTACAGDRREVKPIAPDLVAAGRHVGPHLGTHVRRDIECLQSGRTAGFLHAVKKRIGDNSRLLRRIEDRQDAIGRFTSRAQSGRRDRRQIKPQRRIPVRDTAQRLTQAGRIVRRAYVEERGWSELTTRRALRLAKLRDEGLHWHGTDAAISASSDYRTARRMALELYVAFPQADGIAYRARHNNGEICYALFNRVSVADLVPGPVQRFAEYRRVVEELMALHGACFDTDPPVPPV